MNRFHIIEECQVITRRRGIFQQVDAYHRGLFVYAKIGNGFVRLLGLPNTTSPHVAWLELDDHDGIIGIEGRWPTPKWIGAQ